LLLLLLLLLLPSSALSSSFAFSPRTQSVIVMLRTPPDSSEPMLTCLLAKTLFRKSMFSLGRPNCRPA
jgi:hypothetical protein